MIKQHIFESQDVPERFKCQILSFVRIEWPALFSGNLRLRDWTTKPEMHPVTFLLEEEGILISHLEVVWQVLQHAREEYKAYGLTGVFTYPAFRRQGYGLQLVQSAKDYIEQKGDADIVIFHSTVKGFYEQAGFEPMDSMVTLVGDPHKLKGNEEETVLKKGLCISEKKPGKFLACFGCGFTLWGRVN
jgi:GNAT superfamily N-acetyltransferase